MGFNVCPNLLCSWDDNAHNNSLQLRTNRDNRNNGYNNRNNRNNNGNNRNNNRVRCNARSHRINQLHEDGTYSRGTQDCNQQSAWRVLSQLPLCLKLFQLIKFFRAAIYVLILFFSVIAIIFILFVLIFVILIFILVVLFIIFTKHQQLRTTAVLLWVEPKLKSKLWNAGMELSTELRSLQHGMAGTCFFDL